MALTRADIAERLIAKSNLPKNLAQDFVDAFFEDIASTLEKGEVVKLTGFGNFELKQKKARPGRNPKTGKEVIISTEDSKVTVLAIPTNEELVIARDTQRLLGL